MAQAGNHFCITNSYQLLNIAHNSFLNGLSKKRGQFPCKAVRIVGDIWSGVVYLVVGLVWGCHLFLFWSRASLLGAPWLTWFALTWWERPGFDQLAIRPVPSAVLQDLQVKLPIFFVAQSKEVSSPAVRQHLKSPLSRQLIGAPLKL